jgi:hypothetical protein
MPQRLRSAAPAATPPQTAQPSPAPVDQQSQGCSQPASQQEWPGVEAPARPAASVTQPQGWGIQQHVDSGGGEAAAAAPADASSAQLLGLAQACRAAANASAAAVQLGPDAVQTWEQGQQLGGWEEEEEEGGMCVICHERWAGVMLVHGADGHMCVCEACSALLPPGAPCPLCRRLIEERVVVEG